MEKLPSQSTVGGKPITTFVQTDTKAFRDVVQRLTGSSEGDAAEGTATKIAGIKRSTPKLHERRQNLRPKLEIVKPPLIFKPSTSPTTSGNHSLLPSPAGTPSFMFSPSTILSKLSIQEQGSRGESAKSDLNNEEEEKAIKERRFYLHPSPRSKPGYTEPELLALFPLTSPQANVIVFEKAPSTVMDIAVVCP
ncbi:VQ motif-containing protein 31-like [Populus alba x Populus x berolinensis]|uniref:VQ motif-containing protein 31-like n=1 Tax=Populus alba x Populus x berolinensis TaxID=444605 RepID=A0AAD6R2D1_9ROSI|nr:VQ motif-containing protein 31-like [Populus alba x Populus x berolinensis]